MSLILLTKFIACLGASDPLGFSTLASSGGVAILLAARSTSQVFHNIFDGVIFSVKILEKYDRIIYYLT